MISHKINVFALLAVLSTAFAAAYAMDDQGPSLRKIKFDPFPNELTAQAVQKSPKIAPIFVVYKNSNEDFEAYYQDMHNGDSLVCTRYKTGPMAGKTRCVIEYKGGVSWVLDPSMFDTLRHLYNKSHLQSSDK